MDDRKLLLKMNSGISVMSAFVNWKGAALALDYRMHISVSEGDMKDNQWNIRRVLSILRREYGRESDLKVTVERKIPSGMGLKSSSALVSGIVKAYFTFNDMDVGTDEIVSVSSKISREIKISATGAADDLYASLTGGLCITDNRKSILLKRYNIKEKQYIIITSGGKRSSYDFGKMDLSFLKNAYARMGQRLNSYNFEDIAIMNGFYLSSITGFEIPGDILKPLRFNIMGINGKGPSTFLQYDNPKTVERDCKLLDKMRINFIVASSINLPFSCEWENG
ncbi:MAG: shikimate kinase [Cuniculiplasma sp.]